MSAIDWLISFSFNSFATFKMILWNKWYLIWKSEYSAIRISNEIGTGIIRDCIRLECLRLNLYGPPCRWLDLHPILVITTSRVNYWYFGKSHLAQGNSLIRSLSKKDHRRRARWRRAAARSALQRCRHDVIKARSAQYAMGMTMQMNDGIIKNWSQNTYEMKTLLIFGIQKGHGMFS